MNLRDFAALKKCMRRTTSDNDPEALASIRAANRLLAASGVTWDDVFARTIAVLWPVEVMNGSDGEAALAPDDDLDALLGAALTNVAHGSFRDTILDIERFYRTHGHLTERQRGVVERAARRD
jgi:hypothetical protein